MFTWLAALRGIVTISPYGGLLFWHAHEMIFGFVCAIIVGFLLTAVQNWTGIQTIKGKPLAILFGVWLCARVSALIAWSTPLPHIIIDMSFLPLSAFFLGYPIIKVRQYRNLFFIPVLLLLTCANGMMHLSNIPEYSGFFIQGINTAIWLILLIMTILGGRVIPFFTANGTRTEKAQPLPWLENLTIASTLALLLVYALKLELILGHIPVGLLFFLAAIAHTLRWLRWRFWITTGEPLLWSLHAAYAFIPLGLFANAISQIELIGSHSTLLHFFTAGAMGSLILAMITRVSLGHTGQPLKTHPAMRIAFVLILIGGLLRTLGVIIFPQNQDLWTTTSALLWSTALLTFVIIHGTSLVKPRPDGKPG
jgi:uncharacterized protein involved in response to NO